MYNVQYQLGRFGLFFENVANFWWLLRPIFWARDSWNPTLVKRMLKSGSMLVHTMHCTQRWVVEKMNIYMYMRGWSEICQHLGFSVWLNEYMHYHIRHVHYYLCWFIAWKVAPRFVSFEYFIFIPFHFLSFASAWQLSKWGNNKKKKKEIFLVRYGYSRYWYIESFYKDKMFYNHKWEILRKIREKIRNKKEEKKKIERISIFNAFKREPSVICHEAIKIIYVWQRSIDIQAFSVVIAQRYYWTPPSRARSQADK